MTGTRRWVVVAMAVAALAGCGGQAVPTPTKTPRPTVQVTPLPTAAAVLPVVVSGEETSPLPTPGDGVSPLPTPPPSPVPSPSPTPGFETQLPVPALAGNLACGEGCTAGNPAAVGSVVFDLATGQLNTWVAGLDPLQGQVYEGWLVEGSRAESSGRFNSRADGSAAEFIVLLDYKGLPWSNFLLTLEPDPDDDPRPAQAHSIGGALRRTVMGEALYNRFDRPCQQCHGPSGEGGTGPALKGSELTYELFHAGVRNHPGGSFGEAILSDLELQHIYAWTQAER